MPSHIIIYVCSTRDERRWKTFRAAHNTILLSLWDKMSWHTHVIAFIFVFALISSVGRPQAPRCITTHTCTSQLLTPERKGRTWHDVNSDGCSSETSHVAGVWARVFLYCVAHPEPRTSQGTTQLCLHAAEGRPDLQNIEILWDSEKRKQQFARQTAE